MTQNWGHEINFAEKHYFQFLTSVPDDELKKTDVWNMVNVWEIKSVEQWSMWALYRQWPLIWPMTPKSSLHLYMYCSLYGSWGQVTLQQSWELPSSHQLVGHATSHSVTLRHMSRRQWRLDACVRNFIPFNQHRNVVQFPEKEEVNGTQYSIYRTSTKAHGLYRAGRWGSIWGLITRCMWGHI